LVLTADDVRALLRKEVDREGGQRAWARKHWVSAMYVSYVLNEKKEPGDSILKALGLERVVSYRKRGVAT
jgi:hypothetical protein